MAEECSSDRIPVPKAAFAFCRYTMALLIWVAFLLQIRAMVGAVFTLLVLSAILTVPRAPLVWLYTRTIHRWFPSRDEWLSLRGMRLAHGMGATFAALCLAFLYGGNERVGWAGTFIYGLVKTFSAIWACPIYKLYACMHSGTCCAFLKRRT